MSGPHDKVVIEDDLREALRLRRESLSHFVGR